MTHRNKNNDEDPAMRAAALLAAVEKLVAAVKADAAARGLATETTDALDDLADVGAAHRRKLS